MVERQRRALPQVLALTASRDRLSATGWAADCRIAREAPVVLFLRVSASLACSAFRRATPDRTMAPEGFRSGVRLAPVIILWETIAADVPDALTRRNRDLSPSARSS
jgi:hypothetical protein